MELSLCIDSIYESVESDEKRIEEAARAGYSWYEFWTWWDRDVDVIRKAQEDHGLSLAALCTKFIPLTDANEHDAYLEALEETIAVAEKLSCQTIISQLGSEIPGLSREEMHDNIVVGLKKAKAILEANNMTLVIEPLNVLVDHPGYYLSTSHEAAEIIRKVSSPNILMLFDVYHQQISEGNITDNIKKYIDIIGHFHIAGNPGRKAPNSGEVDYKYVLREIKNAGYSKRIGLEYFEKSGQTSEDIFEESKLTLNQLSSAIL